MLLLGLFLAWTLANGSVEVTIFVLVLRHVVMGPEPLVALNHMVVCCVGRLEAAEIDMVLLELVVLDLGYVLAPIVALRASVLGNLGLVATTHTWRSHVVHLWLALHVVVLRIELLLLLLVHHCSRID